MGYRVRENKQRKEEKMGGPILSTIATVLFGHDDDGASGASDGLLGALNRGYASGYYEWEGDAAEAKESLLKIVWGCIEPYIEYLKEKAVKKAVKLMSNDQLRFIIRLANRDKGILGVEEAQELLEQNKGILGVEAARQLLKQNPTKDDLRLIIDTFGSVRNNDHWLITDNLRYERIDRVLSLVKEAREKLSEKLLEKGPTREQMYFILTHAESPLIIKKVWPKFLKQNPTNKELRELIWYRKPIKVEAAQKLLEQDPSEEDLQIIAKYGGPLKVEAAQKLLEQYPSEENLRIIAEYVEPLRKKALELISKDKL